MIKTSDHGQIFLDYVIKQHKFYMGISLSQNRSLTNELSANPFLSKPHCLYLDLNGKIPGMTSDGNLATYNKAKSLGVFIVSVNWIQACKEQQKLVDEKLYPPRSKQEYENGWTPLHWAANSGQLKVFKSHSREG